jgi:hypothetical protein
LNLGDDTATLSTGAVIQATDRPFSGAGSTSIPTMISRVPGSAM